MNIEDTLSSTPPGGARPEDFEFVNDPDDDFESIEVSTQASDEQHASSIGVASATASDAGSVSEGGETVETVSASGHSDAETIASVGSDLEEAQYNPSDSLRFPDPISTPMEASYDLMQRSALIESEPSSGRPDLEVDTENDDEWSAIRDSEVTIRGPSEETLQSRMGKAGSHVRYQGFPLINKSSDHAGAKYGKDLEKPKSKLKSKARWPNYLGATLAIILWTACLASLSAKFDLYQLFNGWSSPKPMAEMWNRHQNLNRVLVTKGYVDSQGSPIMAKDILVYPRTPANPVEGSQVLFPTEITAKVVDNSKFFVSFPKDRYGHKYLSHPEIQVLRAGCGSPKEENCEIAVLEQEDLIDGVTFVLVDVPTKVTAVDMHFKFGQQVTVVPIQNLAKRRVTGKEHDRQISSNIQRLINKAKIFGNEIDRSMHAFFAKSTDRKEGMMEQLSPRILTVKNHVAEAFAASVARAHVLVEAAKSATKVFKINPESESWKLESRLQKSTAIYLQSYESARRAVVDKVGAVGKQTQILLSRAHRNGLGIAARISKGFESIRGKRQGEDAPQQSRGR